MLPSLSLPRSSAASERARSRPRSCVLIGRSRGQQHWRPERLPASDRLLRTCRGALARVRFEGCFPARGPGKLLESISEGVGGYRNSAPAASAGPARGSRSLMTAGPAVNAPRSVSHFTFERRKVCDPYLAQMGDENASHRMDQLRRPGRAWPALVGCRDVQIGPHAQRGNQLGLDAVKQPQGSRTKLTGPLLIK